VADSVRLVGEYARHRSGRGPWFGFLHTYDVHCPYDPPPPYAGTFRSAGAAPIEVAGRCGNPHFNALGTTPAQARYLSDRYDEDVRRVDDALATLFATLDELGLWDETVVIVTSDHGEEFLEHGRIGHEGTLSPEALSIPLLVHAPGVAPRVVDEVVGLADLVPTVLALAGVPPPGSLDGRSLLPLMRGETDAGRPGWVVSDLAWKGERLVRTTRAGRDEVEPTSAVLDATGLLKLRARALASGYKPRTVDPLPQAAELGALGYF
jgi:arylsulfatase A-like enzyme